MTLKEDDRIVNGLWIGPRLSMLELLSIRSFLANGHVFRLWVYDELENELPDGLQLMDANDIIPNERVFRYRFSNQFGHGKGSVSGFSDIFRYKLLYDHGGWWVDMDVTCLRSLDMEKPYFFRPHHELTLVGNVMKCPKGSELMARCYEQASQQVDENNTDWHLPIEILVRNVKELELEHFITHNCSIPDRWDLLKPYLFGTKQPDENLFFMHWMNEEWRSRGLDKYDFRIDSCYGKLLIEHGLVPDDFNAFQRLKNALRFSMLRFFS